MSTPPITIVATTWAPEGPVGDSRLRSWERSLDSWGKLHYAGDLWLHVADDGSRLLDGIPEPIKLGADTWTGHFLGPVTSSHQERRGVGASLNAGFKTAFETSPLAAYFVDDWKLDAPIDLTPWAKLLMRDESVGMVRLGPPHPGLKGTIAMFDEGWAIRLDPEAGGFVFGHRPALYHKRFYDAYGWFEEGESAFEVERIYNERFVETWHQRTNAWPETWSRAQRPDIIYALPYPWRHIGDAEVGDIKP